MGLFSRSKPKRGSGRDEAPPRPFTRPTPGASPAHRRGSLAGPPTHWAPESSGPWAPQAQHHIPERPQHGAGRPQPPQLQRAASVAAGGRSWRNSSHGGRAPERSSRSANDLVWEEGDPVFLFNHPDADDGLPSGEALVRWGQLGKVEEAAPEDAVNSEPGSDARQQHHQPAVPAASEDGEALTVGAKEVAEGQGDHPQQLAGHESAAQEPEPVLSAPAMWEDTPLIDGAERSNHSGSGSGGPNTAAVPLSVAALEEPPPSSLTALAELEQLPPADQEQLPEDEHLVHSVQQHKEQQEAQQGDLQLAEAGSTAMAGTTQLEGGAANADTALSAHAAAKSEAHVPGAALGGMPVHVEAAGEGEQQQQEREQGQMPAAAEEALEAEVVQAAASLAGAPTQEQPTGMAAVEGRQRGGACSAGEVPDHVQEASLAMEAAAAAEGIAGSHMGQQSAVLDDGSMANAGSLPLPLPLLGDGGCTDRTAVGSREELPQSTGAGSGHGMEATLNDAEEQQPACQGQAGQEGERELVPALQLGAAGAPAEVVAELEAQRARHQEQLRVEARARQELEEMLTRIEKHFRAEQAARRQADEVVKELRQEVERLRAQLEDGQRSQDEGARRAEEQAVQLAALQTALEQQRAGVESLRGELLGGLQQAQAEVQQAQQALQGTAATWAKEVAGWRAQVEAAARGAAAGEREVAARRRGLEAVQSHLDRLAQRLVATAAVQGSSGAGAVSGQAPGLIPAHNPAGAAAAGLGPGPKLWQPSPAGHGGVRTEERLPQLRSRVSPAQQEREVRKSAGALQATLSPTAAPAAGRLPPAAPPLVPGASYAAVASFPAMPPNSSAAWLAFPVIAGNAGPAGQRRAGDPPGMWARAGRAAIVGQAAGHLGQLRQPQQRPHQDRYGESQRDQARVAHLARVELRAEGGSRKV